VQPGRLALGEAKPDELNRGRLRVNVAFTLPPGAYATLVVKRLFHWTLDPSSGRDRGDRRGRAPTPAPAQASAPAPAVPGTALPALAMPVLPAPPPAVAAPAPPRGFLARQRAEKVARKARREAARKR
jgi:tRNA pseudouridine13 synthase